MSAENLQNHQVWERLNRGRLEKASDGGYVGYGSPAFGQQAIGGELVDNPDECEVIELIRRHHKSGKSLQKIADWLNQQGFKTKRGQSWKRISVKRVLDRLYGKSSPTGQVTPPTAHNLKIAPPSTREQTNLPK